MNNPIEQIETMENLDDFLNFVVQLAVDANENADEWANTTIAHYLGQMASWVDDIATLDSDIEFDKLNYKMFAKILYMGKIYE